MSNERTRDYEDDLVEDPIEGDDDLGQPGRYEISSYGADLPVDALVSRLDREDIFIPSFQRRFVWTLAQSSRFIESLLLGLPVPGIFLFKEPETRKLMVVDGQQRLLTLQSFYDRKFNLVGVSNDFNDRSYNTLTPESQRYLNDSIIHATIFQQIEPDNDRSSVYSVFERLNTGGTQLSSQELRACVYRGPLNDMLSEMAGNPHWCNLYGAKSFRKKDEEIILRFLALRYRRQGYERPMKQFLNNFMQEYRHPDDNCIREFWMNFERTVEAAATILTSRAFRPERALNVSVVDAVLVGLSHRLQRGPISDKENLCSAHRELLDRLRCEALYTQGTTTRERVNLRIDYACEAYEAVP